MKRYWIVLLGIAVVVAGYAAYRQWSAPRIMTIAAMSIAAEDARGFTALREALTRDGFREGQEVRYVWGGPVGNGNQLDAEATRLLAAKPDLVFVSTTPGTLAILRARKDQPVPVVFGPVSDPVAVGIAESERHPGGRVTGIRLAVVIGKRLEWFTRIVPSAKHVYVPYTDGDKSALTSLEKLKPAAEQLGVRLTLDVIAPEHLDEVAQRIPQGVDGVFLLQDIRMEAQIEKLAAACIARRLPLSAPGLGQVAKGALFSYGFDHPAIGQQAARLAAQVLRGADAGELPIETADNYLHINLATARQLGLSLSDDLLRQADHLIR